MASYSNRCLLRRSGDVIAGALRRPVTLLYRNKLRLMLLSTVSLCC